MERHSAESIAAAGYIVTAIPPSIRRTADLRVEGVEGAAGAIDVEVKTLAPGASSASIRNVMNTSKRRGGQARHIYIDAAGSGITEAEARRGVARALGAYAKYYDTVTVVGEAFAFREEVRR